MPDDQQSATNELEIAYSLEDLTEKLSRYQLNIEAVADKLLTGANQTNKLLREHPLLRELIEAINSWKQNNTAEAFTSYINLLTFKWLNAVSSGAEIPSVLRALRSLTIKGFFNGSDTENLHLFMYELVTDTVNHYQQRTIEYVLNYDPNTHLPNEKQLVADLKQLTSQYDNHAQACLFSIYFQTSKSNLHYSKITSVDLNKKIADTLKNSIPNECKLYLNNDSQFDILISSFTSTAQPSLLSAKITRVFEEMLFLHNNSILVTPFVGYTYAKIKDIQPTDFYEQAKLALENAVEVQKPLEQFSPELKKQLEERDVLESKVLEGFAADNLTLFFQPIVDMHTLKVAGAELLLRWNDKFTYSVYPSQTIEILNKVGKGKMFTRWLINSACRYVSELKKDHQLDIYLTLNLRAEDLYDVELPHLLAQGISLWKIDAKDVILEITETGMLEYNETSNAIIAQLSELGFKFAIDDFGTGYSSLSRLRTLPIDLIKIDQSFVRDINSSKDDFEIVQSISILAKTLGKEVLAEGIEDEGCLSKIRTLSIDKGQGYHFAKPMPFKSFTKWAKANY